MSRPASALELQPPRERVSPLLNDAHAVARDTGGAEHRIANHRADRLEVRTQCAEFISDGLEAGEVRVFAVRRCNRRHQRGRPHAATAGPAVEVERC
jgi:hypothetical protein